MWRRRPPPRDAPCHDSREHYTGMRDQVIAASSGGEPAAGAITWALAMDHAELLSPGTAHSLLVLAALVVNARMLLYGAALAPHTTDWSARGRWAAGYLLTDPVYALAMARFEQADGGGNARDRFRDWRL